MKLLAPNGKPSNLTPEQYKLVRTPAFKAWFGDWENSPETASKVFDENGEPKIKWRGDNNPKNVFDYINYGGYGVYYFADKYYRTISFLLLQITLTPPKRQAIYIHIYMCKYEHLRMYIYIYVCVCVFVCVCDN